MSANAVFQKENEEVIMKKEGEKWTKCNNNFIEQTHEKIDAMHLQKVEKMNYLTKKHEVFSHLGICCCAL